MKSAVHFIASDISGLIFYLVCYFWFENLSNLRKLIGLWQPDPQEY